MLLFTTKEHKVYINKEIILHKYYTAFYEIILNRMDAMLLMNLLGLAHGDTLMNNAT
jgi:hypothetical protein